MLCTPLDWLYAELPSSSSDSLYLYVRCGTSDNNKERKDDGV